jgi:hypothetical protein
MPASADEELPALLLVFGVLSRVLFCDVVSVWLMWVKEELLGARESREA